MFINALGIHVPHFERFLVKTMRAYRREVKDEKLLGEVQALIGQEAHHAFNFVKWTAKMAEKYPGLSALDAWRKITSLTPLPKKTKNFTSDLLLATKLLPFLAA